MLQEYPQVLHICGNVYDELPGKDILKQQSHLLNPGQQSHHCLWHLENIAEFQI